MISERFALTDFPGLVLLLVIQLAVRVESVLVRILTASVMQTVVLEETVALILIILAVRRNISRIVSVGVNF